MATKNQQVAVGICTPKEKDLQPFVYGVFKTEDDALEHFQKFGDRTCNYRVTSEYMILEWDK